MMARPRKPTAVLELTGAFKKDPQRRRENEPKPSGPLGEEPLHFDEELKAIWRELVVMVPAGVLTISDRWLVELACRTMQQVRKGTALAAERNLLLSCLSRMGLTPADRSKIAVPKEKEQIDELAQLAAESRVLLKPN
jgi:phage terminase small subunit